MDEKKVLSYDLFGRAEPRTADRLDYIVFCYNSAGGNLFAEKVGLSGTVIGTHFLGDRQNSLDYIRDLAFSRAESRLFLYYEKEKMYEEFLNSSNIEKERIEKDKGEVERALLQILYNVRKENPLGYQSYVLNLDGLASLLEIDKNYLLFCISIFLENNYIGVRNIENGEIYIRPDGIQRIEGLSKEATADSGGEAAQEIYDVFISHASEDKLEVVEPLASELIKLGLSVWYDKWSLQLGDSLRKKIDEGLKHSKYGIVVLSPAFFAKQWTVTELNGLIQKEIVFKREKVILPVWHNVTPREVAEFSLILSDKLGTNTNRGILTVAKEIAQVVKGDFQNATLDQEDESYLFIRAAYNYHANQSTADVHTNSLTITVKLLSPPVLNQFRLVILWPKRIRINYQNGLTLRRFVQLDGNEYIEYSLDVKDSIYPGEELELVGCELPVDINYMIDRESWELIEEENLKLYFRVMFERAMPIEKEVLFKDLNCY
ncbi:toll/interleukin-1 receptor domain-containing protein [Paenibacillus nitricinens]|uniref:toll/interleukin-1 receptor domain-containing protein n=1 Tax=Paenibacillus nitricinens TaxID=3367691 RepID=UPI003F84FB1D